MEIGEIGDHTTPLVATLIKTQEIMQLIGFNYLNGILKEAGLQQMNTPQGDFCHRVDMSNINGQIRRPKESPML